MKRILAILFALSLALVLFTGCGNNGAGETAPPPAADVDDTEAADDAGADTAAPLESVTVTMWSWSEPWTDVFMVYLADHPHIEFDHQFVDSGDYVTRLMTAVNAGADVPDIGWIEMGWRGHVAWIEGLWENLEAEPYNLDRNDMLDFLIPLATGVGGYIIGIECGPSPSGIAYKRGMALEFFGTDDPDELSEMFPTWEAMFQEGARILEETNGRVHLWASMGDLTGILFNQSDIPHVVDGRLNLENSVGPAFELLEMALELGIISQVDQWSPAWNASFAERDAIFYYGPSWMPTHVIKPNDPDGAGDWGIFLPPGGAVNIGGTLFGIPSMATNKIEAWEMIRWATFSIEGAEVVRDIMEYTSAYRPVYDIEGFYDIPDPFFAGQALLQKFAELSFHVHPRALIPYDSAVNGALWEGMLEVRDGMSVEDAIRHMEDEVIRQIPELQR